MPGLKGHGGGRQGHCRSSPGRGHCECETNRVGSMVTWFFTGTPVTDFATAATSDTEAFGRFHRAMLDQGVWLPPSQFEAAFLGTAHTAEDIDFTVEAARKAFASVHAAQ